MAIIQRLALSVALIASCALPPDADEIRAVCLITARLRSCHRVRYEQIDKAVSVERLLGDLEAERNPSVRTPTGEFCEFSELFSARSSRFVPANLCDRSLAPIDPDKGQGSLPVLFVGFPISLGDVAAFLKCSQTICV